MRRCWRMPRSSTCWRAARHARPCLDGPALTGLASGGTMFPEEYGPERLGARLLQWTPSLAGLGALQHESGYRRRLISPPPRRGAATDPVAPQPAGRPSAGSRHARGVLDHADLGIRQGIRPAARSGSACARRRRDRRMLSGGRRRSHGRPPRRCVNAPAWLSAGRVMRKGGRSNFLSTVAGTWTRARSILREPIVSVLWSRIDKLYLAGL